MSQLWPGTGSYGDEPPPPETSAAGYDNGYDNAGYDNASNANASNGNTEDDPFDAGEEIVHISPVNFENSSEPGPYRTESVAGDPAQDIADTGLTDVSVSGSAIVDGDDETEDEDENTTILDRPIRPSLHRNQSQPPPPIPMPPLVPAPDIPDDEAAPLPTDGWRADPDMTHDAQPTDSLSLHQLRRIVYELNKGEPVAYDFEYSDMGPLAEEIDEWFPWNDWHWYRLQAAQRNFAQNWEAESGSDMAWTEADQSVRESFVRSTLEEMRTGGAAQREAAIGTLQYITLGVWGENGAMQSNRSVTSNTRHVATSWQLEAIEESVRLITVLGGIPIIWAALVNSFERMWTEDLTQKTPNEFQFMDDELRNLMTIIYIIVQEALDATVNSKTPAIRDELLALSPRLDIFMLTAICKLRWEETEVLPSTQIFLLFWKVIMLVYGRSEEIKQTQKAMSETGDDSKKDDVITATPIDYHVFRQEIISKYPAYCPPPPILPLDAESDSLLPSLLNHPSRTTSGAAGVIPAPPHIQTGGASIFQEPVHIATPAPSPPPSPGVGKGAKKHNYQTNQNFPFMYPPLDATSNSAGGKGMAGLQDRLVGRKWEGSDVPASILEAGELFAKRVRMTRATRQLWDERERFLKFTRGWEAVDDDEIEDLGLDELTAEEREEIRALNLGGHDKESHDNDALIDYGPREADLDPVTRRRLEDIERFYREALPQMQSLVIVLLKVILGNIAMLSLPGGRHPAAAKFNVPGANANGGSAGPSKAPDKTSSFNGNGPVEELEGEELSAARSKEISGKAVAGILLHLLKWFKLSHILKFEYLTQLLVDSNYLPLVLKLLAHSDVQQLIGTNIDRVQNSFFYFCNSLSHNPRAEAAQEQAQQEQQEQHGREEDNDDDVTDLEDSIIIHSSDDEAVPPPIKRHRSPPHADAADGGPSGSDGLGRGPGIGRPEVDELGYPVSLPKEPIKDFSRRNFFALINYLRVMQKCCKNKAHRNLLLVSYKSANILRKSLKVPQKELRMYTLKLFKNQVPYCGRKWRQSNMRVITAVYLHCRPELRDEWLAGSDVDAAVDASLPLEQALRSLTHWFNARRYREQVLPEMSEAMREEQNFFRRELEKLQMNLGDAGGEESESGDWDHDVSGW